MFTKGAFAMQTQITAFSSILNEVCASISSQKELKINTHRLTLSKQDLLVTEAGKYSYLALKSLISVCKQHEELEPNLKSNLQDMDMQEPFAVLEDRTVYLYIPAGIPA